MGHFQTGSDSQIVQSIPGRIDALFGAPAYFNNKVYFSGSGDTVKAFQISGATLSTSPVSQTSLMLGYPGSVPSISANGTSDAIVWIAEPSATLRAYDASDLAKELFSGSFGTYVKFSVPTIANGKVYVGTQDSLVVFGLASLPAPAITSVVNAASFQASNIAPGSGHVIVKKPELIQTVQVGLRFIDARKDVKHPTISGADIGGDVAVKRASQDSAVAEVARRRFSYFAKCRGPAVLCQPYPDQCADSVRDAAGGRKPDGFGFRSGFSGDGLRHDTTGGAGSISERPEPRCRAKPGYQHKRSATSRGGWNRDNGIPDRAGSGR